jgi:small ligand-binding sensory domain FIST
MGVIGEGREIEQAPAISLLAARLPGVDIRLVYTAARDLPDQDEAPTVWRRWLGLPPETEYHFLLLADPFAGNLEPFLAGLDFAYPDTAKAGGLASGGGKPMENALWLNEQMYREGIVAVGLAGDIRVDTVVAQGCRPIGEPLAVTCCHGNILLEVEGQTPAAYLRSLFLRLSPEDRERAQNSLSLGLAMDPFASVPGQGEFLVRDLVGVDEQSGSLATGASLHEGQMVQFQLRDRETSAADLHQRLDAYAAGLAGDAAPAAALLFSCLGRGEYLYRERDHDTRMFRERVCACPVAGFFSNGEIGRVGGSTLIHGYTSVFAVVRPGTGAGR